MRRRQRPILAALILLTGGIFLLSLCAGRYAISIPNVAGILASRVFPVPPTWNETMEGIVFNLRLPRALMAILVGSALSLAGTVYQGIFKNPLVSPDLLGVSAGACVGASVAILLDMGSFGIQLCALASGLTAVFLTTSLPKLFRNHSTLMLVLSGIIVSGFMNAIIGILKFIADTDTKLAEMTYWMMGSISGATLKDILGVLAPVLICMAILVRLRWRMNLLSLGDEQARSLGVDVKRTRGLIILCATLITASVVSISGTIGWVGLVIPHLSRMLVGHDNTRVIPVSLFLGACFMMVVDLAARTVTAAELPLSIVTSFVGAPLYAWMLYKQEVRIR